MQCADARSNAMHGMKYAFGWVVISSSLACSEQARNTLEERLGKEKSALFILQEDKLEAHDAWHGDGLGNAVSVSETLALIGASGDDRNGPVNEGAAYVFERSGDVWNQRAKLMASDDAAEDHMGDAVALSGNTALVAASLKDVGTNVDQGAVYVYTHGANAAVWFERQKLVASDGRSGEAFGRAMAFEGDRAVIGADGSARVFERSGGVFAEVQKIAPPPGANTVTFGRAVALSGNTLIVGSPAETFGTSGVPGAVHVYTRSDGSFVWQQTLAPADGSSLDRFGSAIAISNDTVVVGVDVTNPASESTGTAYVFVRSGGSFSQTAELTGTDSKAQDAFGRAVAALGDFIVVGAPFHEHGGFNADSGSAYVFQGAGSNWTQVQKLNASDGQNNDHFGSAIGLEIGIAVIGSPNDDVPFVANGSAYAYRFEHHLGERCSTAAECQSGFCVEGVCCNTPCNGACDTCVPEGSTAGFCAPVPAGSPGEPACPIACDGVRTDCPVGTPCSADADCSNAEYCHSTGACVPRKSLGSACSTQAGADCRNDGCRVCAGGACIDGVCSVGACVAGVPCSANPCQNGGVCSDIPGGHHCACPPGVNGMDCEVVFTQLSGGHYDMCGLRSDGKIACWGLQSTEVPITAPSGTFKWVSLSQHLCALRMDGSAICQGFGAATPPPGSFKSIYAGDQRACGILENDTVVCWGQNPGGASNPPAGTFKTLALGSAHTCGIRTDGTVECWGLENMAPGFDVGQADPPPGVFTAIGAHVFETCGIRSGGSIDCWGTSSGLSDLPSIQWKMVGTWFSHGCALSADGLVVCTDASPVPGERLAPANSVIGRYKTFAVANTGFACGVRFDNAVICWSDETLTAPPTGTP